MGRVRGVDRKCCTGARHWILEQAFRSGQPPHLQRSPSLLWWKSTVRVLRRELRGKSFLGMGDQTATEGVPGHRNMVCRAEKVGGSGLLAEQWRKGIWRV